MSRLQEVWLRIVGLQIVWLPFVGEPPEHMVLRAVGCGRVPGGGPARRVLLLPGAPAGPGQGGPGQWPHLWKHAYMGAMQKRRHFYVPSK